MSGYFAAVEHKLSGAAKRKVDYFKRYVSRGDAGEDKSGGEADVRLSGLACPSRHDGDEAYYAKLLEDLGRHLGDLGVDLGHLGNANHAVGGDANGGGGEATVT